MSYKNAAKKFAPALPEAGQIGRDLLLRGGGAGAGAGAGFGEARAASATRGRVQALALSV